MSDSDAKKRSNLSVRYRLLFRGGVPFASFQEAESFYNTLKETVLKLRPDSQFSGDILTQLDSCCGEKKL
jgi:hypothetical protein